MECRAILGIKRSFWVILAISNHWKKTTGEPNDSDIMENYLTAKQTLEFMHGPRSVLTKYDLDFNFCSFRKIKYRKVLVWARSVPHVSKNCEKKI